MTPVHRQSLQNKDRDPMPSQSFSRPMCEPVMCYLCDQVEHIARNCSTGKPRPSVNSRPRSDKYIAVNACLAVYDVNHQCSNDMKYGCSFPVVGNVCDQIPSNLPIMQGCVGETPFTTLRDTGCSRIVVKRDLVRDNQLTGKKRILVMINRSAITVSIARCKIVSPVCSGEVEGDGNSDRDESHLCKDVTNDGQGPIEEKKVTCADVTRTETAKQERKISQLKVPDVGNINVTSESLKIAIRIKPYPIPFAKASHVVKEVDKMLKLGVLEPSKYQYCTHMLLVKKPDGTNRPGGRFPSAKPSYHFRL